MNVYFVHYLRYYQSDVTNCNCILNFKDIYDKFDLDDLQHEINNLYCNGVCTVLVVNFKVLKRI